MTEGLVIALVIGVGVVLLGVWNLLKCLNRRGWPETIGKIQKNEVQHVQSGWYNFLRTGLMSSYSSKSLADTDKELSLRLSYVYVVEGYKYVGNSLYSAPVLKVRQRIGGLSEGDKVKVFYKPSNPRASFLAHSFAWPSILIIGVGVAFLGAAAYIYLNP